MLQYLSNLPIFFSLPQRKHLRNRTSSFTFCSYEEIKKYINEEDSLTESGEYLLAVIKKWLKDNVTKEVEWEAERTRLWTPWTK